MPNRIMKEDNYSNLGGINAKASPYITGPQQFLDIKNMDFQQPGSLRQRWGSTQFTSQGFSFPINSVYEFTRLDGFSGVFTGVSGALYFGATTGVVGNVTFGAANSTTTQFIYLNTLAVIGATARVDPGFYFDPAFGTTMPREYTVPAQRMGANRNDYITLNNEAFYCDGFKFIRFNGQSHLPVGLPYAFAHNDNPRGFASFANVTTAAQLGYSGVIAFAASYVNDRGFEGPVTPILALPMGSLNSSQIASLGGGSSFFSFETYLRIPSAFPVDRVNFYSYWYGSTFTASMLATPGPLFATLWQAPWRFLQGITVAGNVTTNGGVTILPFNSATLFTANTVAQIFANNGPVYIDRGYAPLSGTTFLGPANGNQLAQVSPFPSIMEVYQNRLALAGFSALPSALILSDVGEPEGFPQDLQYEVRTNDGDVITALKAFNQRLYVFKRNSFHEFSGDDENNFTLRQQSDEYGAVNNRCVEVFAMGQGDQMVFLDSKGVMKYNGAILAPMSDAIQPIFQTMNYTAAIQNAVMIHDKQRNQLMLSIPVNGATLNNLTVVYDYLVDAWTSYNGYTPTSYATIRSRFNLPTTVYGNHSGVVNYFGPSFASDNGVGFTCSIKTRYLSDLGQTTQKQFRRLWVNLDEANNATVPLEVQMRQDYGASVVYSVTMPISQFQNRIDFGIPAKSLSFEFFKNSATLMVTFHGFGVGYRYQRNV